MAKTNKPPGVSIGFSAKKSEGEMIKERTENAGMSLSRYVREAALRDMPKPKNLPLSLQKEVAIRVLTLDTILRHLTKEVESEWLQDTLKKDINESLAENPHTNAALFDDKGTYDKEIQTEIATAVLTMDAAMKAYLEKGGLGELYEQARNQSRIKVLNDIWLG